MLIPPTLFLVVVFFYKRLERLGAAPPVPLPQATTEVALAHRGGVANSWWAHRDPHLGIGIIHQIILILIGFSITNHPFWGIPIFWNG